MHWQQAGPASTERGRANTITTPNQFNTHPFLSLSLSLSANQQQRLVGTHWCLIQAPAQSKQRVEEGYGRGGGGGVGAEVGWG